MSTDMHDHVTLALPVIESVPVSQSPDEDWRSVLLGLIERTPGGITGVAKLAEQMGITGMGRVYITRVLSSGKSGIAKPSRHFVDRVWQVAGRVYCPHLCRDISRNECQTHHTKTYAQVGVVRVLPLTTVDHWRACRKCHQNPNAQAEQAAISRNQGARHA